MSDVFAGVTADPAVPDAVPDGGDQLLPFPDAVDQRSFDPRVDLTGGA